ncbi:probable aspartyl protease At4g16563 [Mangifera indica]|uniref:probable aspartyl protease At4g16563 n=1 Tax=Mangifera indica TaxID=29780 RepID=UPI001CFB9318|nr:probable aspartyl protease At4g16563 [Mangifera indica]
MATYFIFMFYLIFLVVFTLFSASSVSSSSQFVLLPLTHFLTKSKFTSTHHLLKFTTTRSATRFHRHRNHHQQVSLPLSPGSDYTLSFSLGNSNSSVSLYLDTGSDLVWLPCHPFECILCESKPEKAQPLTISSTASTLSCQSPACSAAHSSLPTSNLCAIAKCPLDSVETSDCESFSCPPLYYAYGDGSLIASLYNDSLSMPISSQKYLVLSNFAFGCAHTTLAEPVGVAGFGRGEISFPAQLSSLSPQLGNRFSYCLVSHSFDSGKTHLPSPLILGRYEGKEKVENGEEAEFVYTEMLDNPKHPYFYSVGLNGISVGKKNFPSPGFLKRVDSKGNGGMVVDSGTTFTMLPKSLYDSVVAEFDRRVGRYYQRASGIEEKTGLSPCYYIEKAGNVPMVKLHFTGNESSVVLPRRNYFYEFLDSGDGSEKKRNVGCLMLMNGGDEEELSGGPGATLGNYQQQGFEVVYDLEKRKVGFARRKCASLWENLNKN